MEKKQRITLHKTVYDTFIFTVVIVLTAALFLLFKVKFSSSNDLYVYVYVESSLVDRLNLTINQTKTYYKEDYPVFIADIELKIENKKVRVEKEESPLNLCSLKGYTDYVGSPVVCLPNSFYFVIMGADYATLER